MIKLGCEVVGAMSVLRVSGSNTRLPEGTFEALLRGWNVGVRARFFDLLLCSGLKVALMRTLYVLSLTRWMPNACAHLSSFAVYGRYVF